MTPKCREQQVLKGLGLGKVKKKKKGEEEVEEEEDISSPRTGTKT